MHAGEFVYLKNLMKVIEKVNRKLHQDLLAVHSREKCYGLLTGLFGLGTYTIAKHLTKFTDITGRE